nr:hypothetical protein [Tanacetum cinerariifolium]
WLDSYADMICFSSGRCLLVMSPYRFQRVKPLIVDPGLLKDEVCQRHLNCLQTLGRN